MQPFSDNPYDLQRFEIPAGARAARGVQVIEDSEAKQKALAQVRAFAAGLNMRGGTALFDAVLKSLKNMADEKQRSPGYQYSVVAFTDGENNKGRTFEEFKRDYELLPEDARSIPVFMVLFGDANEKQLRELVKVTGGRLFDARKTPLYGVFKDIRAYQ
jgi:Ca-activated chloride channel family protein